MLMVVLEIERGFGDGCWASMEFASSVTSRHVHVYVSAVVTATAASEGDCLDAL